MNNKQEKIDKFKRNTKAVNFDRWFGGNKYAELNSYQKFKEEVKDIDDKRRPEDRM